MNVKSFHFLQLLFLILFINSGVFSQYQKNNFEKRSSFIQEEEKPTETLVRVQMLNAKNNKSLSEKKVLYSIDYVFYEEPYYSNGEYQDSIMYDQDDYVTYEFDEYLNIIAINRNPYNTGFYTYTYDVNNRISSELNYQAFYGGFETQRKIYKYDNAGRISEIIYANTSVDDNYPDMNFNNKSKVFLVYDGNFLKKEYDFYWDNNHSFWRDGDQRTYEKTSNYEIIKKYNRLQNGGLLLWEYDSTFFNSANKPKYRLVKNYSADCLCMLDGAEISYEYINDTQLTGVYNIYYKIPNNFDYYNNVTEFSNYEYNENDQLVKYQKFYCNNDSLIFKLWKEEIFDYDTIGNIVYWEHSQIRDTLVYYNHIMNFSYDYENISNNIIKNTDFLPQSRIFFDYNSALSSRNIKHYDNSFLKPINAVSKVYSKSYEIGSSDSEYNYRKIYFDWTLKTLNYRYLTAKSFEKPQMSIIPNPTADNLRFFIAEPYDNAIVQIFDISGKLVMEKEVRDNYIDVSVLRSGLYILRVKTEGGFWSDKFVKK